MLKRAQNVLDRNRHPLAGGPNPHENEEMCVWVGALNASILVIPRL